MQQADHRRVGGLGNGNGYSPEEVAKIVGGFCKGEGSCNTRVRLLLTDSRQILSPSATLFFALKSSKDNGHRYLTELLNRGVRCFVVENPQDKLQRKYPDACFIVVENPLQALHDLATCHRKRHPVNVLAITGSNGKTMVKEWLSQLLSERVPLVRSPKSFNSQIGVPLSVWLISAHHQLGIFEAGISQPGEMEALQQIIQPQLGLLTNIGPAHDEGFSSREEKLREKLKLFTGCKCLIYCRDQDMVQQEVMRWAKLHPQTALFSWGSNKHAQLQVKHKKKEADKTLLILKTDNGLLEVNIPFTDGASIENAIHCIAFMKQAGYEDDYIISKIPLLYPVAMRLEMKEGVNNSTIINDSYNTDLHSLAIALDFLNHQPHQGKKTLILSDILQTGIPANDLYGEVASLVLSKGVNRLMGVGPEISSQAQQFPLESSFFPDTESLIRQMDPSCFHQEAILLKGARVFGFERLSNLLQQKDHQTVLEIDLDALIHNLNVYRSILLPHVKIMAMVKAFSYGSGSVEVARMLQYHHIDYLAVAYADEGKKLRQGGINTPVVVMNPEVRSFETLFRYRLEPEIYGFPLLDRLQKALMENNLHHENQPLPVHIKIDTGMHRLGFLPEDLQKLIYALKNNPRLKVASVFSHLAASDEVIHDAFTKEQRTMFSRICDQLKDALGYPFLRHICNTSATSRFPEARMDMVRLGIGLYGVSGDQHIQPLLRHVSTFRSIISQIKTVEAGKTIGYGRAEKVKQKMTIAIIPVGYADGLDRRLGNHHGMVLIAGQKASLVGHISMDMCAADITDLQAKEGDEVIVFGKELPVTMIAKQAGTIPYEIFTSVSQRVKRIFTQG